MSLIRWYSLGMNESIVDPVKKNPFCLEVHFEIWNDMTGSCIRIGPDRDGLDLIEIRQIDYDGKIAQSITVTKEQATLMLQALNKCI